MELLLGTHFVNHNRIVVKNTHHGKAKFSILVSNVIAVLLGLSYSDLFCAHDQHTYQYFYICSLFNAFRVDEN